MFTQKPRPNWHATAEAQALLARCHEIMQIPADEITLGDEFELTRVLPGKLWNERAERQGLFNKWSFANLGSDMVHGRYRDSAANDAFAAKMMTVEQAIAGYRPMRAAA